MIPAPPDGCAMVRPLARGSTFEVTLVTDGGALRVLKRVRSALADRPQASGALAREAEALSLLRHPRCPELVRVGKDGAGPFLLESYLEGARLDEVLDAWDGELPSALAHHLASRVVATFDELHHAAASHGPLELVHGDPSPSQLIVTPSVDVAVVDFGSAGLETPRGPLAATGHGTLPYAAPELCRGETPSQRSDRYAVAAIVARLLAGPALAPPLDGPALLVHLGEAGLELEALGRARLPDRLKAELAAHLALDPKARPDDLRALRAALDPLDTDGPA